MQKRTISTVIILASVVIAVISLHHLLDDVDNETKKTLNNRATANISMVNNPYNFESIQFRVSGERSYYVITHMDLGNITEGLLSVGSTAHLLDHVSLKYNDGWEAHVSGFMDEVFNEMSETMFDTYMSYLNVIMAIVIMRYQETIEENSTEHLHYLKI